MIAEEKGLIEAIEAVCHKRHGRSLALGAMDVEAAQAVLDYLDHLEATWNKRQDVLAEIGRMKKTWRGRLE